MDLLTANYTFVNERLAKHYGIPNVYGSQFRKRHAHQRRPARVARAGKHLERDVGSHADLAGNPRQVDPRKSDGHSAAGASAECAGAEGSGAGRQDSLGPSIVGGASQERALLDVPRSDGPARIRAREFQRAWANIGRRTLRGRSIRRGNWRMGPRSTAWWGCGEALLKHPEYFVGHADREDADVRAGPAAGVL